MPDIAQRVIRTLLQLLAAGGFTALFTALTDMVDPNYQALVLAIFTLLVTFSQNWLEDTGKIPSFLKDDDGTGSDPRVI